MNNEISIESKSDYKKTLNFLHYNLAYTIHDSNSIIKRFGKYKNIPFPIDSRIYRYIEIRNKALEDIGIYIQHNWQEFMSFYGKIKKDYRKTNFPQKEKAVVTQNNTENTLI